MLVDAYDDDGAGVLDGAQRARLLAQVRGGTRGASRPRQAALAHARSLTQQLNATTSLAIELATVSFAGALMGFASKNPYNGILRAPYTPLSASSQVVLVPQQAMFVGMAVGLAAAPPGVGAIGRELVVYWREAAVGHDALAYYRGSNDARGRG